MHIERRSRRATTAGILLGIGLGGILLMVVGWLLMRHSARGGPSMETEE